MNAPRPRSMSETTLDPLARKPRLDEDALHEVMRDYLSVTERLQRTHESLQREVVRLREELASKDAELERRRRLAALGELAAGVAHEVRNPLGAIQLYSGLLRQQCGALEPALRLIEKIETGIRAIDGVVRDTLALAPRPHDVRPRLARPVLERAQDVSLPALKAAGITLRVAYADRDVRVVAEEAALQRVLVNLIVNAAQASQPGAEVAVEIGREQGGVVEMRVLDRGCGFERGVLEKVFDPFFTTKPNGAGLGLTIAHRLVEAFGGRLSARNRPAGGAEFIIALPAPGRPAKAPRKPTAA